MPDFEKIAREAVDFGFTYAAPLKTDTIRVLPEVRAACAADKCQNYGKNWGCPPNIESLEENEAILRAFDGGIIVQTSGEIESSFDFERMIELNDIHDKAIRDFYAVLKPQYEQVLPLGAGGCKVCATCTCPDAPCRFPDKRISSMEAFGMFVNEVCKKNNLTYNYGPGTLTYVGCFLIK